MARFVGLLTTHSQRCPEPSHRVEVVSHTEKLLDYGCDSPTGPKIGRKPVLPGALLETTQQHLFLTRVQLRRPAWWGYCVESLVFLFNVGCFPTTDTAGIASQKFCHLDSGASSFSQEIDRPASSPFQFFSAAFGSHIPIVGKYPRRTLEIRRSIARWIALKSFLLRATGMERV